jgi:hypothetical protein
MRIKRGETEMKAFDDFTLHRLRVHRRGRRAARHRRGSVRLCSRRGRSERKRGRNR